MTNSECHKVGQIKQHRWCYPPADVLLHSKSTGLLKLQVLPRYSCEVKTPTNCLQKISQHYMRDKSLYIVVNLNPVLLF